MNTRQHRKMFNIVRTGIFTLLTTFIAFWCTLPIDPASLPPSDLTYDTTIFSIYINEVFSEITPELAEGIVDSFYILPPLPEGLLFDSKAGTISGTPKIESPLTGYQVIALNKIGSTKTVITLEILSTPFFTLHPQSVAVTSGTRCIFNALASGKEPLSYIWTKNNAEIKGAGSTRLIVENISDADTGIYRCVVTDFHGRNGISDPARCAISTDTASPKILIPPSTRSANNGEKVVLTTNATGTDLVFQWIKNGKLIADAMLEYLQIDSFSIRDTGTYQVVISNKFGSDTSGPALLSFADSSSTIHEVVLVIDGKGRIRYNGLFFLNDTTFKVSEGSTFALHFLPDSGITTRKVIIDENVDTNAVINGFSLFSKVATNHVVVAYFDSTAASTVKPDSFSFTVLVNDSTAGSVEIQPVRMKYAVGDIVTVTAHPEIGSVFSKWSDTSGLSSNPRTIVIRNNILLTAVFSKISGIQEHIITPGTSINALIAQLSGSPVPGAIIKPEPGVYEEGTVVIEGELEVQIQRR